MGSKKDAINQLTQVPGIGRARARSMYLLGIQSLDDLRSLTASELSSKVPSIPLEDAEEIVDHVRTLFSDEHEPEVEAEPDADYGSEVETEMPSVEPTTADVLSETDDDIIFADTEIASLDADMVSELEEDVLDDILGEFLDDDISDEFIADNGLDISDDMIDALDEMINGKIEAMETSDDISEAETIVLDLDGDDITLILSELDDMDIEDTLESDITDIDAAADAIDMDSDSDADIAIDPETDTGADGVDDADDTDYGVDISDDLMSDLDSMIGDSSRSGTEEKEVADADEGHYVAPIDEADVDSDDLESILDDLDEFQLSDDDIGESDDLSFTPGMDISEDLIDALDDMIDGPEEAIVPETSGFEPDIDDELGLDAPDDILIAKPTIIDDESPEMVDLLDDLSLDVDIDGVDEPEYAYADEIATDIDGAGYDELDLDGDIDISIAKPTIIDEDSDDLDDLLDDLALESFDDDELESQEVQVDHVIEDELLDISDDILDGLDDLISSQVDDDGEDDDWDLGTVGGESELGFDVSDDENLDSIEDLELGSGEDTLEDDFEISAPLAPLDDLDNDFAKDLEELSEELTQFADQEDEPNICADCGETIDEGMPKCPSCYGPMEEEKGLINRGYLHGAMSGRGRVTGLVNGIDKVEGRINGMINGTGRINGMINGVGSISGKVNGLEDGKARITGKINGIREFDGYVNGLTNGTGRVNGMVNGMINGLVNGRVNGLTNGRRTGRVNGMVNGQGRVYSTLQPTMPEIGIPSIGYSREVKRRQLFRKFVLMASVLMLVSAMLGVMYQPAGTQDAYDIQIDGDFADWENYQKLTFDTIPDASFNSNVDIVQCSAEDNGEKYLALYLGVNGDILTGEPVASSALQDTFYIFLDDDNSWSTGYKIAGMGADHMLMVSGWSGQVTSSTLHEYISDTGSSDDGLDWSMFKPGSTIQSGVNAGDLEIQIGWDLLGLYEPTPVDIFITSHSWDGYEDSADSIISIEKSAIGITQKGIAPGIVTSHSQQYLQLDIVPFGEGIHTIDSISVRLEGTLPSVAIQRCFITDESGNALSEVSDISNGLATMSMNGFQVNGARTLYIGADIDSSAYSDSTLRMKLRDSSSVSTGYGTTTLKTDLSALSYSYIGGSPSSITMDGGFLDWYDTETDENDDESTNGNNDIDVREFAAAYDGSQLAVFINVDGQILGGEIIPHQNSGLANTPVDPVNPTTAIFVDSDRDGITDMNETGFEFDFDNDGIPDSQDNDDDNDGLTDYNNGGPDTWLNNTITKASIYIGPQVSVIPRITGEDVTEIFIDSDNDTNTGQPIGDIGADQMMQLSGMNGLITSSSLYVWSNDDGWSVSASDNVEAYLDSTSMEMSIDLDTSDDIRLFFRSSDWSGGSDIPDEHFNASHPFNVGTRGTRGIQETETSHTLPGDVIVAPEFHSFIPIIIMVCIPLILRKRKVVNYN